MKISVVTVCRNSQATIATTLDSFLAQDHPDKEMLIVDGVSADATLDIVAARASPLIRVISQSDDGPYEAMNTGLDHFAGEVVGFLNSDDTFHDAGALSRIATALADADIAYGDLHMVTDHQTKRLVRDWKAGTFGPRAFHLGWMPPHPTFYARRAVIDRVGRFDTSFRQAADYDFMLRAMLKHDFRVRYIPEVIADFQMGGISTRNWRATVNGNLESLRSRRLHLRAPPIDAALFLRPLIRIAQLRRPGRYWST